MKINNIDLERVNVLIDLALTEDLSDVGDVTSKSVIPEDTKAVAVLRCKEDLVCAGLPVAEHVFKKVCPDVKWTPLVEEGEFCKAFTAMAEVSGKAQDLLTAERTALNFLQRLLRRGNQLKKIC